MRSDFNERLVVALNRSEGPQAIQVQLPAVYQSQRATDLIGDETFELSDRTVGFVLKPLGWKVFKID